MKIETLNKIRKKLDSGQKITSSDITNVVGVDHIEKNIGKFERFSKLLGKGAPAPYQLEELRYADQIATQERIPYSLVLESIKTFDQHFMNAVNLLQSNSKALLTLTSNVDNISLLKDSQTAQRRIDRAYKEALDEGKKLGKSEQQVFEEIEKIVDAESKELPFKINTKADVVGFVLRSFKGGGLKRQITDLYPGSGKELSEWIEEVFGKDKVKVGGAAAQIADFLTGTKGMKKIVLYTKYNSQKQFESYKNRPDFLRVDGNEMKVESMKNAIGEKDPVKINHPVEIGTGVSVTLNGRKFQAEKADRIIFLSEYYDSAGNMVNFDPLLGFSTEVLKKIGLEFDYLFVTTPRYLNDLSKEQYDIIAPKMAEEFRILKETGVKIIYEFSGNVSNVNIIRDVLKGKISSMSINDDRELFDVVANLKKNNELDPNTEIFNDQTPIAVYKNALVLAKYLDLERLHIHGHNSDITIRKNASDADLEREVEALLHAKLRVTQWIQEKESKQITPPEDILTPLLRLEGFTDVLNFSRALVKDIFPDSLYLKKTDDHKKEVLINRAKLIPNIVLNGYYRNKKNGDYSVAIIPVKWVYNDMKVTTSSGDVIGVEAALRSGL